MKLETQRKTSYLAGFVLTAVFILGLSATGCTVRGRSGRVSMTARTPRVAVVARKPPPPKKEVRRACPRNSYWKHGRWMWNGSRYVWKSGGCKRLPPKRRGRKCRWMRGGWKKTRRGWRRKRGRWVCGGAAVKVRPRPRKVAYPTRMPPRAKVRVKDCAQGQYYKPGRYYWRGNRWVWQGGRCVTRPATYRRAGCKWVRGGWKRQASGRVVWKGGGWKCVKVAKYPKKMPPRRRYTRKKCPRRSYYKPGRWFWRGGRWVWKNGGCKAIPRSYRRKKRCRYIRGGWKRQSNGRLAWKAGGWKCGAVAMKRPRRMPPRRRSVKKKCPRRSYYKPGRWFWRGGRWVWKKGGCKAIPRSYRRKKSCRFVRGGWKRKPNGRVVWKSGGWKCTGKKVRRRRRKRRKCPRGYVWKRGKCRR